MANIKTLSKEDQERWLEQRGWDATERTGVKMWRNPDTGIPYVHNVAVDKALDACKLPADTELNPSVPPPKRDP